MLEVASQGRKLEKKKSSAENDVQLFNCFDHHLFTLNIHIVQH